MIIKTLKKTHYFKARILSIHPGQCSYAEAVLLKRWYWNHTKQHKHHVQFPKVTSTNKIVGKQSRRNVHISKAKLRKIGWLISPQKVPFYILPQYQSYQDCLIGSLGLGDKKNANSVLLTKLRSQLFGTMLYLLDFMRFAGVAISMFIASRHTTAGKTTWHLRKWLWILVATGNIVW